MKKRERCARGSPREEQPNEEGETRGRRTERTSRLKSNTGSTAAIAALYKGGGRNTEQKMRREERYRRVCSHQPLAHERFGVNAGKVTFT